MHIVPSKHVLAVNEDLPAYEISDMTWDSP
jgi:hypothetical protein